MDYPGTRRRGTLSHSRELRTARVARAFVDNMTKAAPPPRLLSPSTAKGLLPTLASFGTRQAIAKLAARLLIRGALGPVGVAFQAYELFMALQNYVPGHWDMTGWSIVEDCGRAPEHGPYPGHPAGCAPNKFVTESTKGTISHVHPFRVIYFHSGLKLNGQPSSVTGGVRTSLMAAAWNKPCTVPDVAPAPPPFIVEVPLKPAVIQPLAAPVEMPLAKLSPALKQELAKWPQSYESVEPDNYERWNTPSRSGRRVGAVRYPNFTYEFSVSAVSVPDSGGRLTTEIVTSTRTSPDTDTYSPLEPFVPGKVKHPPVREKKLLSRAGYGVIMGLVGTATEALDFVEAMYKALPERYKIKGKSKFWSRAKQVWKAAEADDLNVARSIEELFWNHAEDMLFGRLGQLQSNSVRKLAEQGLWGGPFGTTVGGSNRQDVTRIDSVATPSPTESLRALLEPYYRSYIPRD